MMAGHFEFLMGKMMFFKLLNPESRTSLPRPIDGMMVSRQEKKRFLMGIAAMCASGFAMGGDFMVDLESEPVEREWRFRFTPYLWAAGIAGDFSQFGLPEVEVNESFSEVLENLDFGAMASFEAWRGRYGLLADVMHVRVSGEGSVKGPLPIAIPVSASSTSTTAMLAGQFRWLEHEDGYLDVLGGIRFWSLDSRIRVGAPLNASRGERASWSDPIIGVKGFYRLSDSIFLTGWALAGGYVGNAEPIIDLMAGVGYKLNERAALILAYRHLTVDYREGSFLYDAVQHGFGLGLDLRF